MQLCECEVRVAKKGSCTFSVYYRGDTLRLRLLGIITPALIYGKVLEAFGDESIGIPILAMASTL